MSDAPDSAVTAGLPVFQGGPVQPERGFVIHTPHGNWEATLQISDSIGVTASQDVLAAIAAGHGPEKFLLRGRIADLVNVAGKRTSLAYLNHHLNAIEGVLDGAFVASDDDKDIERVMAFVVAPGMRVGTILAELRRRIDPAFLPRPLKLVAALPRNALGKLPREDVLRLIAEART